MALRYDVIIIGAGHNGLVAAARLGRARRRVLVLERCDRVGGACVTEELWPGFKVSTAAYVTSLLRPEIIREFELERHGLEFLARNPSSFTPFPDGRYLLIGPDREATCQEVAKFSRRDAEVLPRYEAMLERVAAFVEPTLLMTPPSPWSRSPRQLLQLARLGLRFIKLGPDGARALEILTGPARRLLDRWFESEQLKVTLATDSIIGAKASPSMPGTAYVLFHHVMGEAHGVRGIWSYVRGGMGRISEALAAAAREYGADIRVNAEVRKILVKDGRVQGVALADGTEIPGAVVASGCDLSVTFLQLVDRVALPEDFLESVRQVDYSSASLKINVALRELPNFRALPGVEAGPQHRGTIHIAPTMDYIEQAYDDVKHDLPSRNPVIEATLPSAVDPTVAPEGLHLMSMFTQYFPYHVQGSSLEDAKEAYADRCFDIMSEYAPNFRRSVIARQVLAPKDIEERYGLTGGNIFQGAMTLDQLFFLRPLPGYADYRTPIKGLYLCGAATHPGGGVMGACGYNAANEILRDL
jgi:phytoene dehydrogenase-like protein